MWPGRAHSFPFPSAAFPGLPVCWNVSRLGIVTARIFPSQGNRFQLEPGDSSHMGRGYQRGRGEMLGQPQLLRPRGPGSVPILSRRCKPVSPLGRARGNLGFWSCEDRRDSGRPWEPETASVRREHGWPYPTGLTSSNAYVSQEGEPPRNPTSGGALPAWPQCSGLWGPPSLSRR